MRHLLGASKCFALLFYLYRFRGAKEWTTTNCQARDNQEIQVSSVYPEKHVTASNN